MSYQYFEQGDKLWYHEHCSVGGEPIGDPIQCTFDSYEQYHTAWIRHNDELRLVSLIGVTLRKENK